MATLYCYYSLGVSASRTQLPFIGTTVDVSASRIRLPFTVTTLFDSHNNYPFLILLFWVILLFGFLYAEYPDTLYCFHSLMGFESTINLSFTITTFLSFCIHHTATCKFTATTMMGFLHPKYGYQLQVLLSWVHYTGFFLVIIFLVSASRIRLHS